MGLEKCDPTQRSSSAACFERAADIAVKRGNEPMAEDLRYAAAMVQAGIAPTTQD